jgi:hypothetical protein
LTLSLGMLRASRTQSLCAIAKVSPADSRRATPIERFSTGAHLDVVEPVLPDQRRHALGQRVMVRPFLFQPPHLLLLRLGVDDVDPAGVLLTEAQDPVNRLQEVMKLVVDAGIDRAVAMALEVRAGAVQDLLRRQIPKLAVGELRGDRSRSSNSMLP